MWVCQMFPIVYISIEIFRLEGGKKFLKLNEKNLTLETGEIKFRVSISGCHNKVGVLEQFHEFREIQRSEKGSMPLKCFEIISMIYEVVKDQSWALEKIESFVFLFIRFYPIFYTFNCAAHSVEFSTFHMYAFIYYLFWDFSQPFIQKDKRKQLNFQFHSNFLFFSVCFSAFQLCF